MASDKGKGIWIIGALVVVAVIFVVLALKKEPGQGALVKTDVLLDQAEVIKPAHSSSDQAAVSSMKPAEAVVMSPQKVISQESFAVQVYSFKEKIRAEVAIEKLKAKGHANSYIMISDLGTRGIWYRVRVGSFHNEADAQKALAAINAEFNSGIIVTE